MDISTSWRDEEDVKIRWYLFFNQKFFEFRGNSRKTVQDFADSIGISQSMASYYLSAKRIPFSQKQFKLMADHFGDEVYEVFRLPVPDDPLKYLPLNLTAAAKEIRETLAEYKISPDSERGSELTTEILKKFGYKVIDPETEESAK